MHPSAGLFFDPETELGVQDGTKRETQGGRGFGHKALETRRVGKATWRAERVPVVGEEAGRPLAAG